MSSNKEYIYNNKTNKLFADIKSLNSTTKAQLGACYETPHQDILAAVPSLNSYAKPLGR